MRKPSEFRAKERVVRNNTNSQIQKKKKKKKTLIKFDLIKNLKLLLSENS